MRTIALILAACVLVACSACEPEREPSSELRLEVVEVKFFKFSANPAIKYDEYLVHVRIYGATSHPGAGQEVRMSMPSGSATPFPEGRVIEYFDIGGRDNEWHDDIHRDARRSKHHMTLYPAAVDGADMDPTGFAMLPENKDGSVTFAPCAWQTAGTNTAYLAEHDMRGRFVRTDRGRAIHWRIMSNDDGVAVTINRQAVFYSAENVVRQFH